jgi:hypothetical protein
VWRPSVRTGTELLGWARWLAFSSAPRRWRWWLSGSCMLWLGAGWRAVARRQQQGWRPSRMHSWGWARVLFATRLVLVASGGPESRVHLPGFLKGLKLGGGGGFPPPSVKLQCSGIFMMLFWERREMGSMRALSIVCNCSAALVFLTRNNVVIRGFWFCFLDAVY